MTRDLILGTAGHIDHGKTALVHALTGVNTDRLPAEKQRGITIDIGFASLELGNFHIGIVDVPETSTHEHVIDADLPAGMVSIGATFINDYYRPDDPDPSQRDRNAGLQWLSITGPVDSVEPSAFQNSLPHAAAGAAQAPEWRVVRHRRE